MPALRFYAMLRRPLCLAVLALLQPLAQAQVQTPPVAAPKAPASAAKAVTTAVSKPTWVELNPMQQQSLKPLAAAWGGISQAQKRKWLEVSKNYPNLSAVDQTVMHSRMNEWVAMSPQQRAAARLNFAKTKELSDKLTPDEKKAKWQSYQALSPEEKAKLAAKAHPKPTGAATAVKPVESQKLAISPKSLAPLPSVAAPAPIMAKTGDKPQELVSPAPAK